MSTGAVIAIIIAAVIVLALLFFLLPRARNRRLEQRRSRARDIRAEARGPALEAQKAQAEADERAARARREAAEAEARSREARGRRSVAEEQLEKARRIDPDADEDDAGDTRSSGERGSRAVTGDDSDGRGEAGTASGHEPGMQGSAEQERAAGREHFERARRED
jgi:hypothetical protein